MAVRSLNPLEQHAGKIFLGVAVLVCLLLVLHYVQGNPVKCGEMTVDQVRQSLDKDNQSLAEKIKPKVYTEQGQEVNPEVRVEVPGAIPVPKDLDRFDPDMTPRVCEQVLANVGTPQAYSGWTPPPPPGIIDMAKAIKLLAPLPLPQVAADQRVCGQNDVSYVSVCAILPADVYRAFVENIRVLAKANNVTVPPNLPLEFYRIRLQRRLVDANDEPIGKEEDKEEDVAAYTDPEMTRTVSQMESDFPFPGLNDRDKLEGFIKQWMGPAASGQEPNITVISRSQELIMHPKLPDGQRPTVVGYEPPADVPPGPGPAPGVGVQPGVVAPAGLPGAGVFGGPGEQPAAPEQIFTPATVYALDTTVKPASRYQYRIRYELLNPLLCQNKCKDEDYNYVPALPAADWSPWSRSVQTAQDLEFHLVNESGNEPQFEVRRRVKGAWQKQSFAARIGQPVGAEKNGIDYRTGYVVVDIRRGVEMLIRRVVDGNKVMMEKVPGGDTQVILRDAQGHLVLHSMQRDNEAQKEMPR